MAELPDITRAACDRALRRLAERDMDALETVYHKLGRKIFMTAFSVLGDTHAAEDVMQDTFARFKGRFTHPSKGANKRSM